MRQIVAKLVCVIVACVFSVSSFGDIVNYSDAGWIRGDGFGNYLTNDEVFGSDGAYFVADSGPVTAKTHSYFVFDVSSVATEITAATFHISALQDSGSGIDASNSLAIRHYTDASPTITDLTSNPPGGGGNTVFQKMGGSPVVGTSSVLTGGVDELDTITVDLTSGGIIGSLETARTGSGIIALVATLNGGDSANDFLFDEDGTPGASAVFLDLTVTAAAVPEPSSFALLAFGAVGCGIAYRRRKKKNVA